MKITALTDISEASVKDVAPVALASAVSDFISTSLSAKSAEWEKQKTEFQTQVKTAETSATEAKAEVTKIQAELEKVQKQVETLAAEKVEREKVEKFNARMTEVAASFDLDDEARTAIVEEIKAIASDEDFAKWQSKAKVLLKGFAKKAPPFKKEGDDKGEDKCKEKAKADDEDAEAKKKAKASEAKAAVDKAVEDAEAKKGGLPNGSEGTVSLMDKAKMAFARENVVVTK